MQRKKKTRWLYNAKKVWREIRRCAAPGRRIPKSAWYYYRAIRKIKAEVVLAEYGPAGVWAMEACGAANVPLVVYFHGNDVSDRKLLARHEAGYRELFSRCDAILAAYKAVATKLKSLGAPAEKIQHVPIGIDVDSYEASNPAASLPVFVSVGRFDEITAPFLMLMAFRIVLKSHSEAHLRMIGDGPQFQTCRELAELWGLNHAVTFLGEQSLEVVRQELSRARCYIQHSVESGRGNCEAAPVRALQAAASGLPVVATRHAGLPDVVLDERSGFLVDEHDVETMAERMARVVRDPALAQSLGENGRRLVREKFDGKRCFERLWSIIEASADRAGKQQKQAR